MLIFFSLPLGYLFYYLGNYTYLLYYLKVIIYLYTTIVITTYKVLKNLLLLVVVSKVPKGHKQSDEDNH